ncbi:claudin-10-like [Notolabrus celidotus]|uniref:claudin-10-like n=1 Tax=Notolabrus celidotus TaxID=1203425 RepID=UPI00148F8FA2|nr:claudin-10-like [Notolabrus celidotus]
MWRRHAQILGLLLCTLGWGFVGCTLAMNHWRVAQLGGQGGSSVVTASWFWSDLWKDCYEDSTGVVNCVDFGVLWSVKSYIQAVRGLLLIGLSLGLVATVLTFFGMECTRLDGDKRSKDRMLMTASAVHVVGGECVSDLAGYCLYTNRVVEAFLHAKADPTKLRYEIGPPLYLGMVASVLILLGCVVHCATTCRVKHPKKYPKIIPVTFFLCSKLPHQEYRGYKHICIPSKVSHDFRNISSYKLATVVTV